MKTAIVAYVPVVHAGYVKFFKKYPDTLFILGKSFLSDFPKIERDIRALTSEEAKKAVQSLNIFSDVKILEKDTALGSDIKIIMPDENIMHSLVETFFSHLKQNIVFESVFLRWDKFIPSKEIPPSPQRKISQNDFDREVLGVAEKESQKSPDWWRQIGSVIVKDGRILMQGHNSYMPTERSVAYQGDPRSNFNAGESIEISSAIHSEAGLIAQAARKGVSLEGASIYVTVFPCPNCAKIIAAAGIKKVFYSKGYSLLDSEDIFKAFDVELIKVD